MRRGRIDQTVIGPHCTILSFGMEAEIPVLHPRNDPTFLGVSRY